MAPPPHENEMSRSESAPAPVATQAMGVTTVDVQTTARELQKDGTMYLDVRTEKEMRKGHVCGSLNVPNFFITPQGTREKNPRFVEQVTSLFTTDQHILVGCQSGKRSKLACVDLLAAGADDGTTAQQRYAAHDFATNAGMNSHTGHTNPAAMYDGDEDDEEISSQPLLPYVGMEFDSVDDAKSIYEYAFKMGFGIHIGASRNSQKKGPTTLIKRIFQCVHTGKPGSTGDSSNASEGLSMGAPSSSKDNWFEMDVTNKHQKNRLLRHDCKAKMIVGLRGIKWIVSHFVAEHTHPLMPQPELVWYYRSHRIIPQEDMDLIMTMHDVNFSTSSCMEILGRVHGGDRRILTYVKRDVSNVRSKLRQNLNLRDMDLTVEYFKRRVAENPQFYYEKIVDEETNSVTGLFWVDGRTRALYPKYKDCIFFDTTFCTNRYNCRGTQ